MAHTYAKAPPAFAKDPWAWDYTRDRLEQNTGVPYDQWQGKHFAGAAAMYKNVVRKYGDSIANNNLTPPHECVNCGQVAQHYVDDYVCCGCRSAVESAPSHHVASAVIQSDDALDSIKKKLYESLGHAAKDRKAGKAVQAPVSAPKAAEMQTEAPEPEPVAGAVGRAENIGNGVGMVSRNYKAMGADKLRKVIAELEAGAMDGVENDSTRRATAKGESVDAHYEAALRAGQQNGYGI